jgi:hypothetical protein
MSMMTVDFGRPGVSPRIVLGALIISRNPWESEKCGLMLEFDGNLVSDISFCYIFLTTENPFNYEKQCKRHLD